MFCENCGNHMEDNVRFCTRCGSPAGVTKRPTSKPIKTSVPKAAKAVQMESAGGNAKPKNKGLMIGLIIGAVISILLLVGVIVLVMVKKGNSDIKDSTVKVQWDEYEEDDEGNLISGMNYDEDDNIIEKCEWEYDEDGELIKERKYSYLEEGKEDSFREYDGAGDLLKEAKYKYDEAGNLEEYNEFDAGGNQIKDIVYQGEDNIIEWTEWEYDGDSRVIRISSLNSDGTVGGQIEYDYDSEGRKIKEVIINGRGYKDIWKEWKYDGQGNMLKEERYNNDGVLIEWDIYQYDDRGNCVEKIYYNGDGTVAEWYTWEYDENGNRIEEKDKTQEATKEQETYEEYERYDVSDEGIDTSYAENTNPTETGADTSSQDPYYKILNEIYDALASYKFDYIFECEYFTSRLAYAENLKDALDEFGYGITDVNGDGVSELVICLKNYMGQYQYILAMFTMDKGKAVPVIEGYEGSTIYILADGTIYESYFFNSGFWGESTQKFDGKKLIEIRSLLAQDETGVGMPTNYYCTESGREFEITEEEYGNMSVTVEEIKSARTFDCESLETIR